MTNVVQFTDGLNKMTMAEYENVLADYGIDTFTNPAETEYFAKYLKNGERKGLTGLANVAEARILTTKLFADLPHLKDKYADQVEVAKTPVAVKAVKVKTSGAKTPKVKYPDFAIVYRADRQGYEGWYAGKAEAFRPTVEKVQAFFIKKYQQEGYTV
jgi:hypothetical protein